MLNIFYSQTLSGCEAEIFNTLNKTRAQNVRHVIFTPDRCNQQTERQLFELLNNSCYFDVSVNTLTRFTSQVISKHKINQKVLTKPLGIAIIKKILNENEKDLKTFKKAIKFNGFSATLFDTIAMFKSCGVNVDKLNITTNNESLNLKLADIKLVYEKYEEFLGNEWTDSFNKLNLLTKILDKSDCENTHFYFLGFDDFTPQMYEIIAKLSKLALSCSVATAVNYIDGINNKNLYLNNVYLNLLSLAEYNGVKINKIYCPLKLNSTFGFLSKNLLGYSNAKAENHNLISIYKFNNILDEVKFATKTILNLCLKNNLSFDDFAIIVPDLLQYKNYIKNEFEKNNITYFFDESEPIGSNIVLRFYFYLFNLLNNNFLKVDVFNFLFNYTNIDKNQLFNYQNTINLSGLNYVKALEPIEYLDCSNCELVFEKTLLLKNLSNKLKQSLPFDEIMQLIIDFEEDFGFNQFLAELNATYVKKQNIVEYRKLNQVIKKVNAGFSDLVNVLKNYQTNTANVFNIIKAFFENTTIVVPPIINNSVFVADVLSSFVPHKKYAIVLGASDGNFPKIQTDLGIISDADIHNLKDNFYLSPTINIINKRNKFKVFETMLNFDNLQLSYVGQNAHGETVLPCEVINNFIEFFEPKIQIINGSVLQQVSEFEYSENNFIFNNVSIDYLKQNLIQAEKLKDIQVNNSNFNNTYANLFNSFSNVGENAEALVSKNRFINKVENISNAQQLFYNKDYISISQFENYFNCPYKHFVEYGLKLKTETTSEFNAKEIGNVLHEYVKEIVPIIEQNYQSDNCIDLCNSKSEELLNIILNKSQYVHLVKNPQNTNDIKSLYGEVLRINKALVEQRKLSKFATDKQYLEMSFYETTPIKCGNTNIKIKGVIDRVDFCDNEFRVIDYKTGNSDFDDFTEIKSGKKIQLIVYAWVGAKKFKSQPVGAFYLPLKNDFIKENKKDLYKLKGVVYNSLATIINMDSSLSQPNTASKVLNIKTDKNGNIKGGLTVSESEFNTICEYVMDLIQKAVNEQIKGNIEPYPLKIGDSTPCDYCPYMGLCSFSENLLNKYNNVEKIKSVEELIDE